MTDHQPPTPNSPESVPPEEPQRKITWCQGHWAELYRAFETRGFADQISQSQEELDGKFQRGEMDPLWEACQMVNVGAIELFGIDFIVEENAGCPLCAFANMAQYVADVVTSKHGVTH